MRQIGLVHKYYFLLFVQGIRGCHLYKNKWQPHLKTIAMIPDHKWILSGLTRPLTALTYLFCCPFLSWRLVRWYSLRHLINSSSLFFTFVQKSSFLHVKSLTVYMYFGLEKVTDGKNTNHKKTDCLECKTLPKLKSYSIKKIQKSILRLQCSLL